MDKPLPYNDTAEKAILGAILIEPKPCLVETIDILGDAENFFQNRKHNQDNGDFPIFYNPRHQRIYSCLCGMNKKGIGIDLISVTQALSKQRALENLGGEEYLMELMNAIPTTANLETWCFMVKDSAVLRKLAGVCESTKNQCFAGDLSASFILSNAMKRMESLEAIISSEKKRPKMLIKEAFSSGFFTFDYNDGGFQGGKRIILKGSKNHGKTVIGKAVLYAVAKQGIPCFFFSGEREKEYEECDLAKMGCKIQDIQHRIGIAGRNEYYPTSQALENYRNGLGKLITIVDKLEAGQQNMFDYVYRKMQIAAKSGCKLFVLDNLAVLNSNQGTSKFAHQDSIITALDSFKLKYDCDVILIVHPKKGDGFESASGIGEIENLADTVIRFIRLSDDPHIIETENYMKKSKALAWVRDFPEAVKEKITAVLTFEKVKKGSKYSALLEWDPIREVSIEVSMRDKALEYQNNGFWVRHIRRMGNSDLPSQTKESFDKVEKAAESRSAYKDE